MTHQSQISRVLVTGAAGFVGRHLMKALIQRGYTVKAMVRQNTDSTDLTGRGAVVVTGDLRIPETLSSCLENFDAVIHLASTVKGPWEEYLETTIQGTRRLLETAGQKQVKKFIFMSSIAVYETLSLRSETITEDSPLMHQDFSFYERSKIEAEKVVGEFQKNGMDCVILRSGVIYGPGGTLFPPRLGLSLGPRRFLVIGNGHNRIPLVYIDNLIDAIMAAVENPAASGQIFNIVDDQNIPQNDYLAAVKNSVCSDLTIHPTPYALAAGVSSLMGLMLRFIGRPNPFRIVYLNLCARQINYSNERAKRILGWHPRVGSKEAMGKTMIWFKQKTTVFKDADLKLTHATIELKKSLHVGIVGCGVIAQTHGDILKKIKNARIVGLCDCNAEAAFQMAQSYGGLKTYTNLETMLKREQVDVVHILTPPQSHKDLTLQAAQQKCHVFVEKPMAMNTDEAKAMVEASKANHIKLCIGHNHLFDPPMVQARRLIAKGALGQILYAESWYGFNLGENLTSRYLLTGAEKHWAMNLPGKLYQNLIAHPISVLTDIIGCPDEIHAMATSAHLVKAMNTDELKVMIRCNQKVGWLTVSLAVNPRYQFLNIYGTNMCLFVDFLNKTLVKHATAKMIPKPLARAMFNLSTARVLAFCTLANFFKVLTKKFTYFDGTEILIKQFYKSITEDIEIPVSGEEGLRSMEMMDEIWRQIGAP